MSLYAGKSIIPVSTDQKFGVEHASWNNND